MEKFHMDRVDSEHLLITTPYNADFVGRIKQLSGSRWDRERKAWLVPASAEDAVREIMRAVYGRDDRPTQTVTVRIRVPEQKGAFEGPVTIWGKTLASASGRDSGARIGDGVSLIAGSIDSGGSAKNWKSIVQAGAEFILDSVPEGLIETVPDWIEIISVKKDGLDPVALQEERSLLLSRIAEIDRLLAKINGG